MNQVGALAFALREMCSDRYKEYAAQIVANARVFAETFMEKGYKMVSDGTDNHLILMDVKSSGLTGSKAEKILERVFIFANKNSIVGDKSPMNPGGLRIGTPAITT